MSRHGIMHKRSGRTVLASMAVMALGLAIGAAPSMAKGGNPPPPEPHKVWICKYVGEPGDYEVLKDGKQPISTDWHSTDGSEYPPALGTDFKDGQFHSYVLALNPNNDNKYTGEAKCPVPEKPHMAKLTLVKYLGGDPQGPAKPTDWTLFATGDKTFSGDGGFVSTSVPVGSYTLSESAGPDHYNAGLWSCDGVEALNGSVVTLVEGDKATCSITNTYVPPATQRVNLRLEKKVVNSEEPETSWTLRMATPGGRFLDGTSPFTHNVPMGTYKLSEFGGPTDGYTNEGWSCEAQGATVDVNSGDTVVIGAIDSVVAEVVPTVTCKITNTYKKPETGKPTLTLTKIVSGGSAVPKDWTLTATWQKPPKSETLSRQDSAKRDRDLSGAGSISGQVKPGFYTLSESPTVEPGPARYTAGAWKCEGGSLVGNVLELVKGDVAACTITNTYTYNPPFFPPPPSQGPASLTLFKSLASGTGPASAWTLNATGPTSFNGQDKGSGVNQSVQPGVYTLFESGGPTGYSTLGWSCSPVAAINIGAASTGTATLTLAAGQVETCTITNGLTSTGAAATVTTTAAPVTVAQPEVKGAVVTATETAPAKVTALAFTGAETVPLGLSGLLALLLGAGLVATARRQGRRANN